MTISLSYTTLMLYITGIYTATAIFYFFAPRTALLKLNKVDTRSSITLFIVRHWGLLVFCFAVMIMYSAHHPEVRNLVLTVAVVEKAVIVGMTFRKIGTDTGKGFLAIAVVDAICVVLYLLCLFGVT